MSIPHSFSSIHNRNIETKHSKFDAYFLLIFPKMNCSSNFLINYHVHTYIIYDNIDNICLSNDFCPTLCVKEREIGSQSMTGKHSLRYASNQSCT